MATQQSSKLLLYHATSYEFLLEVSIAQAVAQKLQCKSSAKNIPLITIFDMHEDR